MIDGVRRAVESDADALASCIGAAYARYHGLALPDVAGDIDQEIAAHWVWVFESSDIIVGGIVMSQSQDKAHLRNLAVHPAHGGQGIASALIRTALDAMRTQGVRSVELATHVGMPENLALYSHLGWHETGRAGDKVFMSRMI
ncbi:MAG: GNAT family N-acetyltransferase [Sulfitobacter sp.]